MNKYKKKPVVIEAMRYDGDNAAQIIQWAHQNLHPAMNSIVLDEAMCLRINTLEGSMYATKGDWVIRGIKGEFYPCKPDIFAATYEEVKEG